MLENVKVINQKIVKISENRQFTITAVSGSGPENEILISCNSPGLSTSIHLSREDMGLILKDLVEFCGEMK